MHAGGEGRFYIGMPAQLVTDMGEPGLGDAEFLYLRDGLQKRKMGEVFFMTQGIEDDLPAAADLFLFCVIDPVGIGDIGKIAEAKTQYGHFQMPYKDRDNGHIADRKRIFIDGVKFEVRDTRVFYIGKRIREFPDDCFPCHFVGVEGHCLVLKKIVGSYIIQPREMVFMGVGIDDGVQSTDPCPQHLITEIGGSIDDKGGGRRLDQDAGTEPFVFGIGGSAYFTRTGYHRNAGAGAGAQESNFYWRMAHGIKLRNNAGREHIFVYATDFRAQRFRGDLQLGDNIDEGADPAFQRKEFIQDHDFSLFQNAVATLKVPSFITDDVFHFVQDLFDFIECGLSILHPHKGTT